MRYWYHRVGHGYMKWSYVAERFQYIACLGSITYFAAAIGRFASEGDKSARNITMNGLIFGVVAYLASRTYDHCTIYQSNVQFWTHVVNVNPNAHKLAKENLGVSFRNLGLERARLGEWKYAMEAFKGGLKRWILYTTIAASR